MLLYLGSHVRGNSRACSAIKSPFRLKRFGLRNVVSVSSARATKRFPSSRCASEIQSGDQSNSSADLKITQAIRQALVKDGELSMTAKNIKIITDNGQVTLRGPVKNAQEKAKIDQVARSAAGGAKIVDQLDVKKSD